MSVVAKLLDGSRTISIVHKQNHKLSMGEVDKKGKLERQRVVWSVPRAH